MAKKTNKKKPSAIEQLEDALRRVAPGMGGLIGALVCVGLLGKSIPPFVCFLVGGALGGVMAYGLAYGFFVLINPKRDRSKKK